MRRIVLALAAGLMLAPAARAEPEPTYEISVVLSEAGRTVAAPSIRLAAGSEARMEVAGSYRIDASLHATAEGQMVLATELSSADAATWVVEAKPEISLNADGEAMVRVSSDSWDEVEVSIRPAA